jgi:hypothetical protein
VDVDLLTPWFENFLQQFMKVKVGKAVHELISSPRHEHMRRRRGIAALDGDEWSVSRFYRFIPVKDPTVPIG